MFDAKAPQSAHPAAPGPSRISWPAVIGFGALGLLWPVLRLVGLAALIGEPGTVLVALLGALAVWVLGAGLGDVPHPVATLTLAGAIVGVTFSASAVLLGEWPDHGPLRGLAAALIEVVRAAGLGALAGLAAAAIQRSRRR